MKRNMPPWQHGFILAALILTGWQGVCAQTATDKPLEAIILAKTAEHNVPALGAMCIRSDSVQEQAVAGVRTRGSQETVTNDDLWHLGSCTKAMTATLAARLVEQKKLRWDMTIGEVFADVREQIRAEYHDITLELLLTNRGGIPGDIARTEAWRNAWKQQGTPAEQRRQFMLDVLKLPPSNAVGEYLYSNQGFAIAGHMCECVTGISWEELMKREIFTPLKMTSAGFGPPGSIGPHQPVGHHANGSPADPNVDNPPAISPAGRVHCTLRDWARFIAIQLPGTAGHEQYLSAESWQKLHTPAAGPGQKYAMGWAVADRDWGGSAVLTHSGSNSMWFCTVWLSREKNFAVLATCNQGGDGASKACDDVCSTLIRRELSRVAAR